MFNKYLKEISKNNVTLLRPLKKWHVIQNPVIFWYWNITSLKYLKDYRFIYLWNLYKQKSKLESILKKIEKNKDKLWDFYYKILVYEIKYIYHKIDFLKNVYDFEANKLDNRYKISYPEFDYDYYNKKFFWVSKKDIFLNTNIDFIENNSIKITKKQLIELLDFSVKKVPWLLYKFWNYAFMSHSKWTLVIPNQKLYSLREVITLFFHEMTHFFRRYNNIRNYNTNYGFSDYMKIEEGFALYNEYLYWRRLMPEIKYNPYYDACYLALLDEKLSQKQKQEKVYQILKNKWYSREKSLNYYYRFYRYSKIGSKQFFLKDLIYTKWYLKVKRLIKLDINNYNYIFSWRIWPRALKEKMYDFSNNFDTNSYFESILEEIKKNII